MKGSLDNEATFEYHIDINHRGLSFWGEIDEDRNEELPTFFSIVLFSKSYLITNMALKDIEPIVGDGTIYRSNGVKESQDTNDDEGGMMS